MEIWRKDMSRKLDIEEARKVFIDKGFIPLFIEYKGAKTAPMLNFFFKVLLVNG
jgi:hypothetical protein